MWSCAATKDDTHDTPTLLPPQPTEAYGGSQLPEPGLLVVGNLKGLQNARSSAWLADALSPRRKCRQRDEAETRVEQGLLEITVRGCRQDTALH